MKRLLLIISLLIHLLPFALKAQDLSNSDRRHINHLVLNVIKDYERYAAIYDEEAEYYFLSLFENENAPVFCDLMGQIPYLKDVSVSEYVNLIKSVSANTSFIIKNVRKGQITASGDLFHIPVSFKKSISYIDMAGYVLSVNDYYDADYEILLNITYDPSRDLCRITSISGRIDSDRKFPEGRFTIVKDIDPALKNNTYYKHFMTLKIGQESIEFNDFGQAILPSEVPSVDDIDVIIKTDTLTSAQNYDVITFKEFIPVNSRTRFRLGYSPSAYKLQKGSHQNISFKSNAFEMIADIGASFPFGRRTKMSFNAGVGLSFSNISLNYSSNDNEYQYKYNKFDEESKLSFDKVVTYQIESAAQSISYVDLVVPVYFEAEHRVGNYVLITWDVGVKGYLALRSKVKSPYTVNAIVDSDPGILNGWTPESFIIPNTYAKNMLDLSVAANLGVNVNIYRQRLYALLKVGYEYGIFSSYSSPTDSYIDSVSGRNYDYPIIYNGQEHIAVHSLISGIAFNRSGLWISAGLKLKF